MTILFSEFYGWNLLSSRFLIGTYYGILATLPLAPSQLLSIRVLLLEDENKQGKMIGAGAAKGIFIAGVSGFLVAQFAMFLSIYCLPLYTAWFKPHIFNLLLPPLLLWHYFKIVEFDPVAHLIPNYKYPFLDPRVRITFLESFLFQIINPIVLPNPVFTRLMSLALFKYSNIPMFMVGSLLGWLSGQFLFIILNWMLLSRLQLDSPAIYRIVKRVVHSVFPPIMIGICLSYIGRVSMVPFYQKNYKKHVFRPSNLWPDICYNRDRISRSIHFMLSSHQSKLRNQPNAPFNIFNIPFNKHHFSQYFFNVSISDGKQRLIHKYPISISLIENDLKKIVRINDNSEFIFEKWMNKKELRLNYINQVVKNNISNLDKGIDNIIEKRLNSLNENNKKLYRLSKYIKKYDPTKMGLLMRKYIKTNNILDSHIRKSYDPRLGNIFRHQSNRSKNESPWFINQYKDNQISPIRNRNYLPRWKLNNKRLTRLKNILFTQNIYNVYFDLYKNIPIWKSRSKSSSFYYEFEFFKQNLTRRRRRRFFVRSFVQGTTYGRSRNIASIFQLLETKPRSSFFLRAKEMRIDSKENLSYRQRLSQTESEKFDFANSHSVRGPALIAQAFIRKYIKLPTLILGKSLIRLLLLQPSEWNTDWKEWTQEKYIYCFYNGNYVPNNQMPSHWLADGLQIKILTPFHLTPWRSSEHNPDLLSDSRSSYINIWGQETDVPFGEVQHNLFFKPIFKGSILFLRYQLAKSLRILNHMELYVQKKYHVLQFLMKKIASLFYKKERSLFNFQSNDEHPKLPLYTNVDVSINHISSLNTETKSLKQQGKPGASPSFQDTTPHDATHQKNHIPSHRLVKDNKNVLPLIVNEPNSIIDKSIDSNILYSNNLHLMKKLVIELDLKYNKLENFPMSFLLKKPQQVLEYQKVKINILIVQFYQKWMGFRNYIFRLIISYLQIYKKAQLQIQRNSVKFLKRILTLYNKQIYKSKIIFINFMKFGIVSEKIAHSDMKNFIDNHDLSHRDHDYLSHAYILHKVWQGNLSNRLYIHKLLMNWKPENEVHNYVKRIMYEQGLINTLSPQDINLDIFTQWLQPFRHYVPSPEIWNQISPHVWRQRVHEFWVKNNMVMDFYQYRNDTSNISVRYLSYYKPFFEKAKKMTKRWQNHLLTNSYTNDFNNRNLDDLLRYDKNGQQIQLLRFKIVNDKYTVKKHIFHSKAVVWGLANTRYNELGPSFSFNQSLNESFLSKKIIYISPKQPIYYKYENKYLLDDNEPYNLQQRVSFPPINQYRWKSEQQRLKALSSIDQIKKAKSDLKNAIQKAMLATKNHIKSAPIFAEEVKEATFRWKSIHLSQFTCQVIKKRQAKILDDEILMHTIIGSFLRFKKRSLNNQILGVLDPTFNQCIFNHKLIFNSSLIIPEDMFLTKSVREYRILASLNFQLPSNVFQFVTNENLNEFKQPYSNQLIKRYIWSSYRVEDLACMNRFCISTANQSRFSSLRIRMYPNVVK